MAENNIERDIGKILQKLEDQGNQLVNIDTKLTYTNGKIAKTMAKLDIVEHEQLNCPAKEAYSILGKSRTTDKTIKIFMAILGLIQLFLVYIQFK